MAMLTKLSLFGALLLLYGIFSPNSNSNSNNNSLRDLLFLDGSCPWKEDVAKALEVANIRYVYNDCKEEETTQIEGERNILFVIDTKNHDVDMIVKLAHMIPTSKSLYVFLNPSDRNYDGLDLLKHIANLHSTPIFESIDQGIKHIINRKNSDNMDDKKITTLKQPGLSIKEIKKKFEDITAKKKKISLLTVTERLCLNYCKLNVFQIRDVANQIEPINCKWPEGRADSQIIDEKRLIYIYQNFSLSIDPKSEKEKKCKIHSNNYDWYICQSKNNLSSQKPWIEHLIYRDSLRIHKCIDLKSENLNDELEHMKKSRIILLIISGNDCELELVIMASYLIGLKAKLVLVIQDLKGVDNVGLSEEVGCNAARLFIRTKAKIVEKEENSEIKVFDKLSEAMEYSFFNIKNEV